MNEHKIINDPVFGFIKIKHGLLYDIVQHPLFQRLNRINQLGLASAVYPGFFGVIFNILLQIIIR